MEFHEKLQYLRKQHDLTQEQLAEKLYVSRAAVSKWESGKGYPNIESLKAVSKLFSVSIDELLSGNELLALAETENRTNLNAMCGLIFGVLDLVSILFIFLPLFGQREGDYIRTVALFANTELPTSVKTAYCLALGAMSLLGIAELLLHSREKRHGRFENGSIALHAAAVFLFVISPQPYVTASLFLLLMVKVALILKKNRMKASANTTKNP